MDTATTPRIHPMRKPRNHKPVIQRYTARFPEATTSFVSLYIGVQGPDPASLEASGFPTWLKAALAAENGPDAHDHAAYIDSAGDLNRFAAAYWLDPARFAAWRDGPAVTHWWDDPARLEGPCGVWREAMLVPVERSETNHFKEYPAGVARVPGVRLAPHDESGYFGAMRDRIPLSASERFETALPGIAPLPNATRGARWRVTPPKNLVSIRSGVTWEPCGPEQRDAFETAMRPVLDRGMEHLRTHAIATGCCCLRQVRITDPDGAERPEAYSQGYFLSLRHLEAWAHSHESHLAIYRQALADRKRYQERLELRTYHEVFTLPSGPHTFDYVNCHPGTGLLPWFDRHPAGR